MLSTAGMRGWVACTCISVLLLLIAFLHFFLIPHIYDKKIRSAQQSGESTLIPVMNRSNSQNILQASINYRADQPTKMQIFSGGCVQSVLINHNEVNFNRNYTCDLSNGLIVDLRFSLKEGRNSLEIITEQPQLMPPQYFSPLLHIAFLPPEGTGYTIIKNIMIACVCLLITIFMQQLTKEYGSGILLSAASFVFFYWFSQTNFMQYTMDMPGHLQYISYIAEFGLIPPTRDGWGFYHAPLYYAVQALILRLGNYIGSFDPVGILRLFNILYFQIFLVFGALTLRLLIKNCWAYYCACLMLFFYPSGILFSSRLDSHLLLYPLYAGAVYFLLRWIYEERPKHLGTAFCLLGCCIATRTNGYILFPIFMIGLAYKWKLSWYRKQYFKHPFILAGMIVLILGLGISKGRPYYNDNFVYKNAPPGVGNVEKLGPGLIVQNNIENFVYFDVSTYIQRPFWHVWRDENSRQYFWNSMLKSSLFGEFQFGPFIHAKTISLLLLWIIIYQLHSTCMDCRYCFTSRKWWVCTLLLCIPIAALMHSRWEFPYACTQDFRYIYPAIIAFCGMLGITIERFLFKKEYLIPIVTSSSIMLFSYFSSMFFLTQ